MRSNRMTSLNRALRYGVCIQASTVPGIGHIPEGMLAGLPPEHAKLAREAGERYGVITGIGQGDIETRKAWDRVLKGPNEDNAPTPAA